MPRETMFPQIHPAAGPSGVLACLRRAAIQGPIPTTRAICAIAQGQGDRKDHEPGGLLQIESLASLLAAVPINL
jgi:hypothetical protein